MQGNRHTNTSGRPRCRLPALLLLAVAPLAPAQQQPVEGAGEGADAAETAPPRYTVEIILFRYGERIASGGEVFPSDEPALPEERLPEPTLDETRPGDEPGEPPIPEFGDRMPPAESPAGVELELEEIVVPANLELAVLPPGERSLVAEYDKLVELDAYEPVLWAGWTQSTFEEDVTPAIRLRRLGRAPLSFDGTLELYMSRFLHLVVDLSLEAPRGAPPRPRYGDSPRFGDDRFPAEVDEPRAYYRIEEDRIVRNGDLRYFDHPKFGLLARVTRVEPDPEETEETEETGGTAPGARQAASPSRRP